MKRILLLAFLIGLGHLAQGAQAYEHQLSVSLQCDLQEGHASKEAPTH